MSAKVMAAAFPDGADHYVVSTERQVIEAVHLADGGEAAADGGEGMAFGLAGQIGGQRGGRHRLPGQAFRRS